MNNVIKKFVVVLLLIMILFLTSCKEHVWTIEKKIEQTAVNLIDAITVKDEEALFQFFASDIQDNRESETMSEIQQAFDFIDGKIVSYDYHRGGGERRKSHGNIEYYDCRLRFTNVTTDTGKKYSIDCTYHYIWNTKPECEGITKIIISEDNNRNNQVQIGRNYDIRE